MKAVRGSYEKEVLTSMDKLVNALVAVTLVEMTISIGLGVTFGQVLAVARDWRQVTQAAVAEGARS